jgi:signal transduction histidine kinase
MMDGRPPEQHVRSMAAATEGQMDNDPRVVDAIAERNWVETQLAGEKRLLEMIASGRSLSDILAATCKFVEEAAADCVCGVFPIDWSGPIFHNGVAPSLPASYIGPIEGLPVRRDAAPCGIAALTKTQVIIEDMQSDPEWQGTPFQQHVQRYGLRSVWSTPIYALDGEVLGTFAIYQRRAARPSPRQQELIAQVTHITSIAIERAKADDALKRGGALLAEGERLSSTGTFSWRVMTGEITWSEQVYRIFDLEPYVPVTLDLIGSRLHPEDVSLFQDVVERARTDASRFEFEHRLLMSSGSVKHVRLVAQPTRDHDGRLEYIGAVQDVTERRLSEEALGKVRSELAHVARVLSLGTLTASIAHEVNQPLSGIITNASTCLRMLDAEPPNVEGARETARRTIRDGHRASEVITRLRALFSKRDRAVESVDLNEATREVIALSRSELQRKCVFVRPELADDLPPVTGDRVQLQQVILNLLLNASDAMSGVDNRPRQAVITTERDEGDAVRLTVQDTGEGLGRQAIEKIFEPFYTTKDDGMGIGLAVSRSIIESHGGRIWAKPNEGPGATFSFSIPRCGHEAHLKGA